MADTCIEIVIARPLAQVAEYASNPDNAPDWYINIKSVRWITEPPLKVGSEIAFTVNFMGEMCYTYRIMEFGASRLVMTTEDGPFPTQVIYEWETIDNCSTRMKLCSRGTPAGINKFLSPVLNFMSRRENLKDLNRLKNILEAQSGDSEFTGAI